MSTVSEIPYFQLRGSAPTSALSGLAPCIALGQSCRSKDVFNEMGDTAPSPLDIMNPLYKSTLQHYAVLINVESEVSL